MFNTLKIGGRTQAIEHSSFAHCLGMRAQLACLPTYMDDTELAGRAAYTWSALSSACHHHTYEVALTARELQTWFETVAYCVRTFDGVSAGTR